MAFALIVVGMLGACGSDSKTGSSSAPDTTEAATVAPTTDSTVAETNAPTTEAATTTADAPDPTDPTMTDASDTPSFTKPIDYRRAAEQAINQSSELEHGTCELPDSVAVGTTFTCTADVAEDGTTLQLTTTIDKKDHVVVGEFIDEP